MKTRVLCWSIILFVNVRPHTVCMYTSLNHPVPVRHHTAAAGVMASGWSAAVVVVVGGGGRDGR